MSRVRCVFAMSSRTGIGCAVYRDNRRLIAESSEIGRCRRLSHSGDLFCDYYATNRPVVITGMIDDWPALRKWNLDYFYQLMHDRQVEMWLPPPASTRNDVDQRERYVTRIPFGDFVAMSSKAGETAGFHLTAHHTRPVIARHSPNCGTTSGRFPNILPATVRQVFSGWPRASKFLPFQHALVNHLMAQVFGRSRLKIAPSSGHAPRSQQVPQIFRG